MAELLLDALLAVALVWLGWRLLGHRDAFTAVVLFIAFGLLMALVWVRLAAPDIALAEAAVGAGVTGALLLDAVHGVAGAPEPRPSRRARLGGAGAGLLVAGGLAAALAPLATAGGGLGAAVEAALPRAGAAHPVTAVLLDLRAYDTWLETAVLAAAALAVLALRGSASLADATAADDGGVMLGAAAKLLAPLLVLCAGFLLWLGSHAPGGAFQAGAVLGSAGILLLLARRPSVDALAAPVLRAGIGLGLLAFTLVAVAVMAKGARLLTLPAGLGGVLILVIEGAVALAVAVTLAALFAGARPLRERP